MGISHSLTKSFFYAFQGLFTAIKREPNMRIHTFFAVFAVILGLLLNITRLEWLAIVLTISMVFMLELVNTLLEALVNIVSPEFNKEAKVAKDVSAAAVLVGAIASVIIGIIVFGPRLIQLIIKEG